MIHISAAWFRKYEITLTVPLGFAIYKVYMIGVN